MKTILSLGIVVVLLLTGFGATTAVHTPADQILFDQKETTVSIDFSTVPTIKEKTGFIDITVSGANAQLEETNRPILPLYIKNIVLPWGSKNINVICAPKTIQTMDLTGVVLPAQITSLSSEINTDVPFIKDETIYSSKEFYPDSWTSYRLSAGRNYDDTPSIFVDVVCQIVRYAPAQNKLEFSNGFTITVTYEAPHVPHTTSDAYDLVIIAPKKFEKNIQPLIDSKNQHGMNTIFKSVEDILADYQGHDEPEQVKYFIKYAFDTWGIKYVLLFGGLKSHLYAIDKDDRNHGSDAWNVPVRYVNIHYTEGGGPDQSNCLCDLYYGDLYDADGSFSSWDSNSDGIYAACQLPGGIPDDTVDLVPEVYVGRLPCVTAKEVTLLVNKIITYESTGPAEKPWYKTMIGIGGKSHIIYNGQPDGEYQCNVSIENMNSIIDTPIRVFASHKNSEGYTPTTEDITSVFSKGAGYIMFEGHGNPLVWKTFWRDNNTMTSGINRFQFYKITNKDKLPVVVTGGCTEGLYNLTIIRTALDKTNLRYFTSGTPASDCFAWALVIKPNGGAIASTGSTGYSLASISDPLKYSPGLDKNFFYQIGQNGSTTLGAAHSGAIRRYIQDNAIDLPEKYIITNWQLFGDPSLKLGGYSS
jgi:hypothetical protein